MKNVGPKLDASAISEFFIQKANLSSPRQVITNKKIQKLVYYAQAWSLAINGYPLFSEKIEAWVHGPAIRSIYGLYKEFGFNSINKTPNKTLIDKISDIDMVLLEQVWKVYGKFDSSYLEMLTHSESPWQEARAGIESSEVSDQEITKESMKAFYSKKRQEATK